MIGGRSTLALRGRGKDDFSDPVPKGKGAARLKRVNGIKGRLEAGKYRIEPKKVADKMVEDAIREIRSRGN
jgi:anti-sigma28 factor (negative regulator of flagellin synthesis)